VCGTGVEIPAEVTFRVDLEEAPAWPRVWIETADAWITTGHAPDLFAAVRSSVEDMTRMLERRLGVSHEYAFMLFSAAGDARIGQCADLGIDMTAYAVFPKPTLPSRSG
jgi:amidase